MNSPSGSERGRWKKLQRAHRRSEKGRQQLNLRVCLNLPSYSKCCLTLSCWISPEMKYSWKPWISSGAYHSAALMHSYYVVFAATTAVRPPPLPAPCRLTPSSFKWTRFTWWVAAYMQKAVSDPQLQPFSLSFFFPPTQGEKEEQQNGEMCRIMMESGRLSGGRYYRNAKESGEIREKKRGEGTLGTSEWSCGGKVKWGITCITLWGCCRPRVSWHHCGS